MSFLFLFILVLFGWLLSCLLSFVSLLISFSLACCLIVSFFVLCGFFVFLWFRNAFVIIGFCLRYMYWLVTVFCFDLLFDCLRQFLFFLLMLSHNRFAWSAAVWSGETFFPFFYSFFSLFFILMCFRFIWFACIFGVSLCFCCAFQVLFCFCDFTLHWHGFHPNFEYLFCSYSAAFFFFFGLFRAPLLRMFLLCLLVLFLF